ncbi:MAG: hypothetical protein KGL35_32435 [Bradyrhizobium sp.]|nr:hypothetical protein [Bradyrhizobium sp.]
MKSFCDFVQWAGGVRKAAALIGRSPATVSRVSNGLQTLELEVAREVERVSEGRYRAADLLGLNTAPAKRRKVA